MPHAPINGIQLYYKSHGEGPVIVFAHGGGGSHLSWWQQIPVFSQRYRCITFDHRGYGQSLESPEGPGGAAFTDDLIGLLDHLGIAECRVVAQSLGGASGFGLALAQPQRVKALVMADTVIGIPSNAIRQLRLDLAQQGVMRAGPTGTYVLRGGFAPGFLERDPARAFLYAQLYDINPPRDRARFSLFEGDDDRDLSGFPVPTLFLFGTEDDTMPPPLGRLGHQLVGGSRYVEVEGCGHSVYWEKPDAFNALVAAFFAEVGA